MIEGQTPNTVELSNLLPLETERQDFEGAMVETLIKIAGVTLRSRDEAWFKNGSFWVTKTIEYLPSFI